MGHSLLGARHSSRTCQENTIAQPPASAAVKEDFALNPTHRPFRSLTDSQMKGVGRRRLAQHTLQTRIHGSSRTRRSHMEFRWFRLLLPRSRTRALR